MHIYLYHTIVSGKSESTYWNRYKLLKLFATGQLKVSGQYRKTLQVGCCTGKLPSNRDNGMSGFGIADFKNHIVPGVQMPAQIDV